MRLISSEWKWDIKRPIRCHCSSSGECSQCEWCLQDYGCSASDMKRFFADRIQSTWDSLAYFLYYIIAIGRNLIYLYSPNYYFTILNVRNRPNGSRLRCVFDKTDLLTLMGYNFVQWYVTYSLITSGDATNNYSNLSIILHLLRCRFNHIQNSLGQVRLGYIRLDFTRFGLLG